MELDKKEVLFKEIDLLQACITRMANNSFEIKKWTVGLIAVLSGLIKVNSSLKEYVCLFLLIVIVFWGLDAYFLHIERRYRKKYNDVIWNRTHDNMEKVFNLSPVGEHDFKDYKESFLSKTLVPFYGALLLFVGIVWFI
ncbi:MAG: hypothetical protein E7200_14125 [Selenomonas ruminantium]|nr:hypothetical protein [Selenomonas ruminantium]